MPPHPRPVLDRIMAKVEPSGDCLIWTGAAKSNGYGVISDGRSWKSQGLVHRLAYEAQVGPIPDGMAIDHLCGVRRCVNVTHLEPVTQAENNRRAGVRTRTRNRVAS